MLDTLLTLGPTFIKLGQLLSTRPDVAPPEYVDVLSSLQDEVPPADWTEAKEVLEAELGPVEETFDEFDTDAISGASLGQVYRAVHDGEQVAVKVRRPGIVPLVNADLRVLRWSLPVIIFFVDESSSFSLSNLADEFAKTIRQEMDYGRERAMLEEIRENFADDEEIRIPRTHIDASGESVLTMEYLPGTKINDVEELDAKGIDRTELAERLQRIYLQMIIDDGVFHADPHPGNLAVDEEGAVIFYDFGMSGRVEPYIQEKIVEFYVAIAQQDTDAILDALVDMGTLSPEADREVMGQVMELAIQDARGEDIEQYRVQQIIEQVEGTIYEFPLRLPRNLALVLRVATVVEGVCVTLDPDFDFISVATDYLTEQGYREQTARRIAGDAADQAQETAGALVTVPPKLDRVLDGLEDENLTVNINVKDDDDVMRDLAKRLILGIFVAAGVLSAALIYAFGQDWRVSVGILGVTAPLVVALWRSFRRKRKSIRATPQFTRQSMRERDRD
ncbi:Predicted unusual protein kinase regulating ubiquinone biosynthesis, AarF/ABC1/UbiB family [Halolamina pelagica]|uniref:Predicted unusual protein kinase regulating ubiquinone biosynthesis, AarF/ABC1/UbiB family n=1 Tax=Halolamina pelagica TaxID=699431 RepID=A0A1I5RZH8_9EURY|nr:Predicted unusual protein kinase regulating ubiquinone biosynthesis, AarF/ABC1/UbiB family [Halolamina pelagica]